MSSHAIIEAGLDSQIEVEPGYETANGLVSLDGKKMVLFT